MYRPVKIKCFGDFHVGHSVVSGKSLVDALIEQTLPYSDESRSFDILVIEGDYWDKLLAYNHIDSYEGERGIFYILNWCKFHDITLFIVDGTPLHDSSQSRRFNHINEEANLGVDIRYHEDIVVDYISKFDMYVLFIPDKARSTPEETYTVVLQEMERLNIDMIDMAVMHGCFKYQMLILPDDVKHDEEDYFKVIRGIILIGHIHTFSRNKKIIASGSFGRLRHGEEEPKGWTEIILQPSGEFKAKFLENKMAKIFKTIDVTNMDTDETHETIKKEIEGLPIDSHVRIKAEATHPIFVEKLNLNYKSEYPNLNWTSKVVQDNESVSTKKELEEAFEYIPLIINDKNIHDVCVERMIKNGVDSKIIQSALRYLEEIK